MTKSSTGSDNKPAARGGKPSPATPEVPAPVQRAVKLMLWGAPASIVFGVYGIIYSLASKSDIIKTAHYTNSQFTVALVLGFVFALVYAALWVFVARTCQAGRAWARIVASVLFLVWTFQTYRGISGLKSYFDLGALIVMLGIWGIGVAALYYLWRPESGDYFRQSAH